jgi:hypothetical protein
MLTRPCLPSPPSTHRRLQGAPRRASRGSGTPVAGAAPGGGGGAFRGGGRGRGPGPAGPAAGYFYPPAGYGYYPGGYYPGAYYPPPHAFPGMRGGRGMRGRGRFGGGRGEGGEGGEPSGLQVRAAAGRLVWLCRGGASAARARCRRSQPRREMVDPRGSRHGWGLPALVSARGQRPASRHALGLGNAALWPFFHPPCGHLPCRRWWCTTFPGRARGSS